MLKKVIIGTDVFILLSLIGIAICIAMGEAITPIMFWCLLIIIMFDWVVKLYRDLDDYKTRRDNQTIEEEDDKDAEVQEEVHD